VNSDLWLGRVGCQSAMLLSGEACCQASRDRLLIARWHWYNAHNKGNKPGLVQLTDDDNYFIYVAVQVYMVEIHVIYDEYP
jgi:hypothetical protein